MLGNFLQIIAAIGLLLILLVIAFYVYNSEEIKVLTQNSQLHKQVVIFNGMYDLKSAFNGASGNTGFSTSDPSDPSFLDISYSVNQKSGAEMSYSFWLYLDYNQSQDGVFPQGTSGSPPLPPPRSSPLYTDQGLTFLPNSTAGSVSALTPSMNNTAYAGSPTPNTQSDDQYLQPVVLFVRGEKVARIYKGLCYGSSNDTANKPNQSKADVLIKSPLVKLENNGDVLSVEFNTTFRADAMIENAKNTCTNTASTNWKEMNSYKVAIKGLTQATLQKQFFLVTITLQDTYPSDPISIRDKIRARIYINTTLQLDTYISYNSLSFGWNQTNSIKMNNGNLFVAPIINDVNTNQSKPYSKLPSRNTMEIVMANLTYYNYALNADQINNIYKAGFTQKFITSLLYDNNTTSATSPTYETSKYSAAGASSILTSSATQFN